MRGLVPPGVQCCVPRPPPSLFQLEPPFMRGDLRFQPQPRRPGSWKRKPRRGRRPPRWTSPRPLSKLDRKEPACEKSRPQINSQLLLPGWGRQAGSPSGDQGRWAARVHAGFLRPPGPGFLPSSSPAASGGKGRGLAPDNIAVRSACPSGPLGVREPERKSRLLKSPLPACSEGPSRSPHSYSGRFAALFPVVRKLLLQAS